MESVGQALRMARHEHKIKMLVVCASTGWSGSMIHYVENGQRRLTIEALGKLPREMRERVGLAMIAELEGKISACRHAIYGD
jgi:transcriptional regulator with XRE-family HTH domain